MITEQRLQVLCSIGNKLERAMRFIQESGYVNRWLIQGAVLDIDVSESTMYRAKMKLKSMGAIDDSGRFVGRGFIPVEEISSLFDTLPKILDYESLSRSLFATDEALYWSIRRAEQQSVVKRVNGGTIPMYYRVGKSA